MKWSTQLFLAFVAKALSVSIAETSGPGSKAPSNVVRSASTGKKKIIKKKVLKKTPATDSRNDAFDFDSMYGSDAGGANSDEFRKTTVNSLNDEINKPNSFDLDSDDDMNDSFHSNSADDDNEYEGGDWGQGSEKGALYDAYNLLHTLAQVN